LRDGSRARAAGMGISRLEIDRVGRLSEGHSGRLLSRKSERLFAIKSLGQILKALGVRLLLVEDPETTARTRRLMGGKRNEAYVREDNHWRNAERKPTAARNTAAKSRRVRAMGETDERRAHAGA
jgi:hypothetical protein